VKVISDEIDFELPATDRFVDPAGQFRSVKFALHVALRPWLWAATIHLARNSAQAAQALCDHLKRGVISSNPKATTVSADETVSQS
jgi:hypothetical protein